MVKGNILAADAGGFLFVVVVVHPLQGDPHSLARSRQYKGRWQVVNLL
jgi:hypothetical protein